MKEKMKKKKFTAMLLASALCLGLATGCGGDNGGNTGNAGNSGDTSGTGNASGADNSSNGSSGDTIKIALICNTTGDYAQYGVPVNNGAMLYIQERNEAGGINGKQIEVLPYDDKGDGIESVNAYNQAKDKGVTAVIGSVLTGPTITLADATAKDNMPQITASATAAGVTQIDPDDPDGGIRGNVFRSCFIDPFQAEKMADYAVNRVGAKTAAILYESGSDYSEGLRVAFENKAAELGLQIVATEAFASGDKDFNAQMANIANAKPDVVYMPIYYTEAGPAVTQGRQAGLTATVLGGDGFGGIKDYATAEDLEGTVYCSGYAPGTESVTAFETNYEATYGDPVPNMFAPLAYDAAMLMCNALEEAEKAGLETGSDEYKQAVINALAANTNTQGITGSYTFDQYNNPIKSLAMLLLKDGEETFHEFY